MMRRSILMMVLMGSVWLMRPEIGEGREPDDLFRDVLSAAGSARTELAAI